MRRERAIGCLARRARALSRRLKAERADRRTSERRDHDRSADHMATDPDQKQIGGQRMTSSGDGLRTRSRQPGFRPSSPPLALTPSPGEKRPQGQGR